MFREARADLSASFNIEEPFIVANLIVQSLKKLQKALFFCIGEPDSIQELLLYRFNYSNPISEVFYSFQSIINYWLQQVLSFEVFQLSGILLDAEFLFNFTKIFIQKFIGDAIPLNIVKFPEKIK